MYEMRSHSSVGCSGYVCVIALFCFVMTAAESLADTSPCREERPCSEKRIAYAADLNRDGLIDMSDVLLFFDHLATSEPGRRDRADFDWSGVVDMHDFNVLLNHWSAASGGIASEVAAHATNPVHDDSNNNLMSGTSFAIEIGCWSPFSIVAPPDYVFPAITTRWTPEGLGGYRPVDEYVEEIECEINDKLQMNQPIWLVLRRWLGLTVGQYDETNLLAHEDDQTAVAAGMWPDIGLTEWIDKQEELIDELDLLGIVPDAMPLDFEASLHQWSYQWTGAQCFRNIVLDNRWNTERLFSLGFEGAEILDQADVMNDPNWVRNDPIEGPVNDSLLAHDHCAALGQYWKEYVTHDVVTTRMLNQWPNMWLSNYNSYRRVVDRHKSSPTGGAQSAGIQAAFGAILDNAPDPEDVQFLPQFGTHATRSLYGGAAWRDASRWPYVPGDNQADVMLKYSRMVIEWQGGDGSRFIPWIATPGRKTDDHFYPELNGERVLSEAEYEQLVLGLVRLGVRRFILFNPDAVGKNGMYETCQELEDAEIEMDAVFQDAHDLAESLDAAAPSQQIPSVVSFSYNAKQAVEELAVGTIEVRAGRLLVCKALGRDASAPARNIASVDWGPYQLTKIIEEEHTNVNSEAWYLPTTSTTETHDLVITYCDAGTANKIGIGLVIKDQDPTNPIGVTGSAAENSATSLNVALTGVSTNSLVLGVYGRNSGAANEIAVDGPSTAHGQIGANSLTGQMIDAPTGGSINVSANWDSATRCVGLAVEIKAGPFLSK